MAPETLEEFKFIGQERILERLRLACQAARLENRALDPVLITGPAGNGKSTLAARVARECQARPALFRTASDYRPEDLRADLRQIVTGRPSWPMLVLDELHAASPRLRAALLPFMDQISGQTPGGEALAALGLAMIGLTNKSIDAALRRRFPIQLELGPYREDDLVQVIELFARSSGIACDAAACRRLAHIAFTPGRVKVVFTECRNRALAQDRPLDEPLVLDTLHLMGIDPDTGLDERHLAALRYLCRVGCASARAVSLALGIDEAAYASLEEFLLRLGYISVTPRGRVPARPGVDAVQRLADEPSS